MLRLMRKFWKAILAVTLFVGILYLPQDIQGLPKVIEGFVAPLLELMRNTFLLIYATCTTAWIVWGDMRPFTTQWLRVRNSNKNLIMALTRQHAVGKNILTRKVNTAPDYASWLLLYNAWFKEANDFVSKNMPVADATNFRYVVVERPRRFGDSFNDEHNRLRNIMWESVKRIELMLTRFKNN